MKYQEYAIDQKITRPDGSHYLSPIANGRFDLLLNQLISSFSDDINNGRNQATLVIFGFTPSWQKLQVAEFDVNFKSDNYRQTAQRIIKNIK